MPITAAGPTGSTMTITDPQSRGSEPTRFETAERIKTGVKEASDVVALPGGRFLIVGDTSGNIGVVDPNGQTIKISLPGLPKKKPSEMEGVAYDPVRHNLMVSREESREIYRYDWNPDKSKGPELKKKIDVKHLGGDKNKGIEGLAYLPGDLSPWRVPVLLGVKEGQPRQLMMFDAGGSKSYTTLKLDPRIRDLCKDFSAIAVDPKTGHIYISSDASAVVAEVELKGSGQNVTATLLRDPFAIEDEHKKPLRRIEGLTFNEQGDLFVLTENDGELLRLARK